ncbi:hypothetical protein SYNPS1DRAFT_23874 [Syncephalis pseudoplumigaleata]|uniref:DEAD-box RNA helicase Q domain-containing protein n=1 Tax=Syncephalis pseudoplumigaleata TaxID=1712513 RepID=A0A4P9YXH8_9FUNG|nr:hypothetical protein SYNPS1DRAFT_23874 [Syncephalis pseudoplumigaleata]|eukprot:RKP24031.1 hypothetical protein SYNPS1DRAFT_23874 [Syncephalis pseudoplumigaleata]
MAVQEKQTAVSMPERKRSRKKRAPGKRARALMASSDGDTSEFVSGNSLPWRPVSTPGGIIHGDDDLGGFLCLEEVDAVECVWEGDDTAGKVCRFKMPSGQLVDADGPIDNEAFMAQQEVPLTEEEMQGFIHVDDFVEEDPADTAEKPAKTKNKAKEASSGSGQPPSTPSMQLIDGVSVWENMGLAPQLVQALHALGYTQPTKIQAETYIDVGLARVG